MKLEAKFSLLLLQTSKSVLKSLQNHLASSLLLAILIAGSVPANALAGEREALAALRGIATQQGGNDGQYVQAVTTLIQTTVTDYLNSPKGKTDPNHQYDIVNDLIAEAIKLEPAYACDLVKAGIKLVTPAGTPDPKLLAARVALLVGDVVLYIQNSDPTLVEQIAVCATADDPDAGPLIMAAIADALSRAGNGSANKLNQNMPNNANPTPTPTPPAPTPVPAVTPVAPI